MAEHLKPTDVTAKHLGTLGRNRWLTASALALMLVFSWAPSAQSQTTVEERLTRLEEGQKALEARLVGRIDATSQRIGDLRADVNGRFDDLRFWLQNIAGLLVLVIGGLIAQWLTMWKRLIRVDTIVADHLRETEKEQLIAMQRQELTAIRERVDRLEGSRP